MLWLLAAIASSPPVRLTLPLNTAWQFAAVSGPPAKTQTDTKAKTSWQSQYNIANVAVGDARFDLSGSSLEAVKAAELPRLSPWQNAQLPHAVWLRPMHTSQIWQGVAYYRRSLDISSTQLQKHAVLRIEGAMQVSDLWLNGVHVGAKRGGYLPMVIDLTGKLKSHNQLLVRVDNDDNPLVPPGKPQADLDFVYGNGLYRSASLTLTPKVYITDPILSNSAAAGVRFTTLRTFGFGADALVSTQVQNDEDRPVHVVIAQNFAGLADDSFVHGKIAVTIEPHASRTVPMAFPVHHPNFWSPDGPALYRLTTTVLADGRKVDEVAQKVGLRTIAVSRAQGFELNGKPLRLFGTNRHQDYPWIGIAVPDNAQERDAVLIKESGHNIVRLSHYPQSPAFLDACDELGLFVIPCIPGWQFQNRDPRFQAQVEQDIRDLIRRDRNHPCVAFWETSLNETYPGAKTANRWSEIAHQEGASLTAGDAQDGTRWDIAYNQWRDADMGRPQDAQPQSPGYIREYGDYEFGGATSSSRVTLAGSDQQLLQQAWNEVWSLNHLWKQYPWTMGYGTWEMFDHNVPWSFAVSASGLADLFRRPKPSYYFFQSEYSPKPMAKIVTGWQPGPTRDVVVFSNADQVELRVNGKVVGALLPARGAETPWAKSRPFDGSNTANLPHPPFVFRNVAFSPGELTAVALRRGKSIATDRVFTAGRATHLRVYEDTLGVPLAHDGSDVVFLRAQLLDAQDHPITTSGGHVTFHAEAPAEVVGESTAPIESGVASCLLRTHHPGPIRVTASLRR